MARKILAAGNWKMNKTPSQTKALIAEMREACKSETVDVLLCVPAICIPAAVEAAAGSNIQIGAENMYFEESGAYTGEISPEMIVDAGATYVIMGHSERRDYFGESNEDVNKKVLKALEHNLVPVMCCGESLTQREQGITMDWIRQQVKIGMIGVSAEDAVKVVIAYEPIWAIGTGKTATAEQAEEVCKGIRDLIRELYGDAVAEEIRILYGGSVNPGNAAELFAKEDIDGGLVGGASLKTSFGEIVNYNK
ncbi:MAG: triose-phosphate isomerase [Eubacteriales bacterium]|nr:triose-phosphate isomerase [Eubacteriales bacterium]